MNVSKFLLLIFILIAVASQVAQFLLTRVPVATTNLKLTWAFLASIVLAYVFLVYVVYKVKFHDDEE